MSEIQPALTPEQWAAFLADDCMSEHEITNIRVWNDGGVRFNGEYEIPYPRAVAAVLLYGQPEGFTQEEVEAIEDAQMFTWVFGAPKCAALKSAAAKIAALLPPVP